MRPFQFSGISTRVVFGSGTLPRVSEELARLGARRPFLLSTAAQADAVNALKEKIGTDVSGTFTGAVMHTPTDVTGVALDAFRSCGADSIVALGGGSTIGLGKALATRTGADQLVIPTTYAGSEMTDILGETENGQKITRRDPSIRPETVIYDVDLTLSLPPQLTVTSALNAIAHGIEALYAPDANPILGMMAGEAMAAFAEALPRVTVEPDNLEARTKILYGAWLCSTTLGYVTMGLHHKLAHVLGGSFGTPHAETHAILIPHVAAFNAEAAAGALAPVAHAFGSVGAGLWDFAKKCGAPMRLSDLGLTREDIIRAAALAAESPYANPRPVSHEAIQAILEAAWEGRRPSI